MADSRLCLEPLRPSQYRQVAEWEWGPQPTNTDWGKYVVEMNAPEWAHFALYSHAEFVGCISLEKIDNQTISYHVVAARHKVRSKCLAQVLLDLAGELFQSGYTSLVVSIPREKERRAAAILAIRCGMLEEAGTDEDRHFKLTKARYSGKSQSASKNAS